MKKFIKIITQNVREINETFLNVDKIFSIEKVKSATESGYGYGSNATKEKISNFNYKYLIYFDSDKKNSLTVCLDYKTWDKIVEINQDFEPWLKENYFITTKEEENEKIKWT